ncbi:hypothetical protein CASFOL_024163 [Castilleja foliolosa]|uniref:RING-type domain-containing protein n=1 Tax=Castilleja foliolosa TaxID=1961234 RepID=A0ABD3CPL7_9LAMI
MPHGSNAASRDWSVGPHEPYWRNNTSFSPPPSRWDFPFQPESLSFGSHDGVQLFGSSASSNSRDSRGWMRGNNNNINLSNHQFLVSDGIGPYVSSPIDVSPGQQWTPPAIQEISNDDYGSSSRDVVLRPSYYSPAMEGTSAARNSGGSTSSRSDSGCDYESMIKSHRNRRCFMPKAIHPLSFPSETRTHDELGPTTPQTERHHSSNGSLDFADPFDHELHRSEDPAFRCSLCERLLSQRPPWGPRRIMKTGDMPVSGVLACRHVFHAECLDQTTPKALKSDPPCPVCTKIEEESLNISRLRNASPRLKTFCEDASSKPWGCAQAGDCVEGALHGPSRNAFMSLKFRKNLSAKGNNNGTGLDFPGKLRKSESFSPRVFVGLVEQGGAGSSKAMGGSNLK